jgi:ketosteroid isomerase-like protein
MHRHLFFPAAFLLACCAVGAQTPGPATPAPGAASTQPAEIAQFQKIEDAWSDAVNRRDQYALELVLSPLFVDISSSGNVTSRDQQVVETINNQDKSFYLTQKVITVRMLGDVAVANGTYDLRHRAGSGTEDEKGVFTQVFERVRNGWLCINAQRTLLREDTGAKAKKQQQSTAAEPFHIPFFSKSDKSSDQ